MIAVSGAQVPHGLIRAHGFIPVALTPAAAARRSPTAGVCAVAHGWAEALLSEESRFAAAVLTTRCDQMRRTADALRGRTRLPVFLLNTPVTHGTEAALRLEREELDRLGGFLKRLECGPAAIPDKESWPRAGVSSDAPAEGLHRVGLLGCCLTETDHIALQLLRQVGLEVAVSATECSPGRRPPIAQRPNAPFYDWLRQQGRASRLEGWVLIRQTWCDLYHAEVPRLKSETALPWLDLEIGACPAFEAVRTRAEAFVETLRASRAAARLKTEGGRE